MNLADVVKERLERGQTAATYIELIDIDELERLNDAYLTLQDGKHLPAQPPPPLTSDEFKHYVRLVYDAIKSVDMAADSVKTNKDGSIGKSTPMELLDSMAMFEIQLVAGKLVKAVHRAQSGTITMPASNPLTGIHFHRYNSFPERMDKVIVALKTWKSFGKALFTDEVTMEKRLAMQPEQETGKKGANKGSNDNQHRELQLAKNYRLKPGKPAAVANNDEQENKSADGTPAPASKKRRPVNPDAVLSSPGARRGRNRGAKRQLAAPPNSPSSSANASPSVQSDSSATLSPDGASDSIQPAASPTPTANNTAGSVQPGTATGAAFSPISRPHSSPPADAWISTLNAGTTSGRGPFDPRSYFDYPSEHLQGLSQAYDDKFKFPGPLGTPMSRYSDQGTRIGGLSTNQRPLGQMPQTPQPAHLPSQPPHQQHPPPPDYLASQRAAYGSQQSGPRRSNPLPQAIQQSQVHGAQSSPAQNPRHQQAPQHGGVVGSNGSVVPASIFSNEFNGDVRTGSGKIARVGTVVYGVYSSGVINNYHEPRTPSPPGGQPFDNPHDGNNQRQDDHFGRGNSENQDDNQVALERDNSLPPWVWGNSPAQAHTADLKVEEQDHLQEDANALPALHPSNYSLRLGFTPPAVAARHSSVATSSAPAPKTGFSLDLAEENLTDAMAIWDCRGVGLGLPPAHTLGWLNQQGGYEAPYGPPQSMFHGLEEDDWVLGLKEANDDFVPFREASEEWEYDFKEETRNRVNNESGDKAKPEEDSEHDV